MKVTDPKSLAAVGPQKAGTEAPIRKAAPVETVSTVHSQQLQATVAHVQTQLPVDRAARVREIALAVKRGQYQPNPQQIAERIVDQAELEARLRALLSK